MLKTPRGPTAENMLAFVQPDVPQIYSIMKFFFLFNTGLVLGKIYLGIHWPRAKLAS